MEKKKPKNYLDILLDEVKKGKMDPEEYQKIATSFPNSQKVFNWHLRGRNHSISKY